MNVLDSLNFNSHSAVIYFMPKVLYVTIRIQSKQSRALQDVKTTNIYECHVCLMCYCSYYYLFQDGVELEFVDWSDDYEHLIILTVYKKMGTLKKTFPPLWFLKTFAEGHSLECRPFFFFFVTRSLKKAVKRFALQGF